MIFVFLGSVTFFGKKKQHVENIFTFSALSFGLRNLSLLFVNE